MTRQPQKRPAQDSAQRSTERILEDIKQSTPQELERIQEGMASRIQELINPTAYAASPTQEDWYWGRMATGGEEDYWWRRLSDNWYQKDVIPSTYLELHNRCYEAYNANPLAFAIVEITTSFVIGKGVKVTAKNKKLHSKQRGISAWVWHRASQSPLLSSIKNPRHHNRVRGGTSGSPCSFAYCSGERYSKLS